MGAESRQQQTRSGRPPRLVAGVALGTKIGSATRVSAPVLWSLTLRPTVFVGVIDDARDAEAIPIRGEENTYCSENHHSRSYETSKPATLHRLCEMPYKDLVQVE